MRLGSLCTGYGGLDMAVHSVYGGTTAWVSDIDKGARKILAHRYPDTPNLGDITTVDWRQVEPVDVLCGGTPCQDLSHAGKRAGMTTGTRSNLWVAMREAIAALHPTLVVWENVGGAYSAAADSDMEPDAGLLGDRPAGPVLRALGRVLGDLASLGYDACWHGLRAADVGAPHGRLRVFVVANSEHDGPSPVTFGRSTSPGTRGRGLLQPEGPSVDPLLPTPTGDDAGNLTRDSGEYQSLTRTVTTLLPTPAVNDMGEGKTVEAWDAWTETMKAKHGNGNGHGPSLSIEAQRLLPTPTGDTRDRTEDTARNKFEAGGRGQYYDLGGVTALNHWGEYAAAINRWEHHTRPAPAPTETGPKGTPRLNAAFSEWMMGLPPGWVTDTPHITRNEALRALGNGVVPQQAEAALRTMHAWEVSA